MMEEKTATRFLSSVVEEEDCAYSTQKQALNAVAFFFKHVCGVEKPVFDVKLRKTGARVAVFTQHHADQLDLAKSALENLVFRYPAAGEAALRAHLGRHDVGGDLALRPCRSLSGGQKSRVAFAALTFSKPHVLVMDEPSNHLDLETTDALVGALRAFKGGLVVVSHDQHFINQVCRELWVVGDAALRRFEGTFDDYKAEALRLRQLALEAPRA